MVTYVRSSGLFLADLLLPQRYRIPSAGLLNDKCVVEGNPSWILDTLRLRGFNIPAAGLSCINVSLENPGLIILIGVDIGHPVEVQDFLSRGHTLILPHYAQMAPKILFGGMFTVLKQKKKQKDYKSRGVVAASKNLLAYSCRRRKLSRCFERSVPLKRSESPFQMTSSFLGADDSIMRATP
uniref:Uncharacterized protein n=1 Tax=Steinernema glaseri TaxID=37863 RepID=A0A1I7ZCI4_9BILA